MVNALRVFFVCVKSCSIIMRDDTFVALGVLSSKGASGQASGAQYLARRTQLRESASQFANADHTLQMRFLLAAASSGDAIQSEQTRHHDIVFLPINESRFNWCDLLSCHGFPLPRKNPSSSS